MAGGFFGGDFMPHGHCYYWRPDILWTTVISDAVIALSYFAIPIAILIMVRRHPELRINGVLVLFAAFIFGCGSVHLIEIWNIWHAYYGVQASMKAVTAAISFFTAIAVWRLIPQIDQIYGPSRLAETVEAATATLTADRQNLVGENEELSGQVGNLVTELQQRNRQVEQINAELLARTKLLEQSNEELQQFAYIASHDLQSPLRNIAGFVQLLQRKCSDRLDDDANDWIARTIGSVQHMQQLINDLLTFSRVESKGSKFTEVDLNKVINDACGLLHKRIEETGLSVEVGELPTVFGDSIQLKQAMTNLLDNAAKYHSDESPVVKITAVARDDYVEVAVEDNGIGIAEKHQKNVFEIFRRLHTQEEYPGTGIGLAVVQRVMRRHNSIVRLESAIGKGCKFLLRFPNRSDSNGRSEEWAYS